MSKNCNAPLHPDARLGIRRFNQKKFWDAHEALEDAWNDEPDAVRDLYRGILQEAVVYHHLSCENLRGAQKVYARSQKWLQGWDAVCRGVDIKRLQNDLDAALEIANRLGSEKIAAYDFYPKIRMAENDEQ